MKLFAKFDKNIIGMAKYNDGVIVTTEDGVFLLDSEGNSKEVTLVTVEPEKEPWITLDEWYHISVGDIVPLTYIGDDTYRLGGYGCKKHLFVTDVDNSCADVRIVRIKVRGDLPKPEGVE